MGLNQRNQLLARGSVVVKVWLDRHKLQSDPALILIKSGQPPLLMSTLGLYEVPREPPKHCK